MKIFSIVLVSGYFLGLSSLCQGDEPKADVAAAEKALVKKEIESVISAVFLADMDTIARHTHERVFAIVGDRETFLAEMKKLFGQFKEQGVDLVSAEVGDEIVFFEGETHKFVLVPTSITFKVGGEEQPAVPGHQLGVKAKGDDVWKYLDCSGLTTEIAREWFPDFPADREIPSAPAE